MLSKIPAVFIMTSFLFINIFVYVHAYAHGAHEHGTAKVDMAIDANVVNMRLEVPAISIYGFEHTAKIEQEKKEVAENVNKLRENIYSMVVFPANLNCKVTNSKIDSFVKEVEDEPEEMLLGAEHGNVVASFTFTCSRTPAANLVKFSFQNIFSAIHKIVVQALGDKVQKGATLENGKGELQL